jgi:diacylglycerol kinase family enzyme
VSAARRKPKWPARIRTLLLHNPKSGDGRPGADQLIVEACKLGLLVSYQSTKDPRHKAALLQRWDLIVVAGGDGTVAKVARRLRYRKTPIIILPIGTANNIARSLGLNVQPLANFLTASLGNLNVGQARGPWGSLSFVESVGVGAIAAAISQSEEKPPKPFRVATGREELGDYLEKVEPYHVEISVDGEVYVGEFLFVEVLNLSFSGPSLAVAFSAAPDDKFFDVVFLSEKERRHMLDWLAGHPDKVAPPVVVHKGRKISITWVGRPLRVDDRVYFHPETATKVKIRFEARSLKVLIPAMQVIA